MGTPWDNGHKYRKTRGTRKPYRKKQKYELGHSAANTKIGPAAYTQYSGGNEKYQAWRLEVGKLLPGLRVVSAQNRDYCCVYNATNSELVRTKTLVKNRIVLIDSTRYQHWCESH